MLVGQTLGSFQECGAEAWKFGAKVPKFWADLKIFWAMFRILGQVPLFNGPNLGQNLGRIQRGGQCGQIHGLGGGQNVVWPPFKRELSAIKKRMVYHGQHLNFGPFWPLHLKMTVSAPGQNGLPCVKLPCFGTGFWLTQIPH